MANSSDLIGEDSLVTGVNFGLEFEYLDDEGAPVSLVGYDARFVIEDLSSGVVIATYSTATGHITIPVPADGKFYLNVPANVTAVLAKGTFYFRTEIYIGATNVQRLSEGTITVVRKRASP